MARLSKEDDVAPLQRKIGILALLVLLFSLVVIIRLYYLQVHRGSSYRTLADAISVREEEVNANRGLILDRSGRVLADNRTYFQIVVVPQYIRDRERLLNTLTGIIPVSREEIEGKLKAARYNPPFMPVILVEDAPFDWVAKIRERERPDYEGEITYYLEGVEVRSARLREYLYPEPFSHALGYLKEIDRKTMEAYQEKYPGRYSSGDLMGASGIEGAYDLDLRGEDGVRARVVDARGKEMRGNAELEILQQRASIQPVDGYNLVSTLDFDAQMVAAKAMEGKRGSVVAIEPSTGEILAMYSGPGFDANRIVKNIDKDYWKKINLDQDKYLLNRAIQGTYPPGSTYKIVTALAGLHSGKVKPETSFNCGGGMSFGSRYFKCWNKGGHGGVSLVSSLAHSCDVYFYNVGLKVGVDAIKEHATLFGLGEKTGVEIAYEQPGLIPSTEWKLRRLKSPWIESETLSIAIGQGYDLTTPLQLAKMVAMVANGSRPFKPHLGKIVVDRDGKVIRQITQPLGDPVIPPEQLHLVQQGLYNVVHGGTAKRLAASPYNIAGKTGTSQVIGHDSGLAMTERRMPHGWFVAYAPFDNPKIAISVIVENGGSGSGAAAPVAMQVIDTYLGKIMPMKPDSKPEGAGKKVAEATRP